MTRICLYCPNPVPPSRQNPKFCCGTCRTNFHNGLRKLGERLFNQGAVTIEQVRAENTATKP
ncbi:MAG: hypothetical protein LCH62_13015 [Proteobacteria bacterium]|nr:hypothetical protein [Pseudomonadota bacterium]